MSISPLRVGRRRWCLNREGARFLRSPRKQTQNDAASRVVFLSIQNSFAPFKGQKKERWINSGFVLEFKDNFFITLPAALMQINAVICEINIIKNILV